MVDRLVSKTSGDNTPWRFDSSPRHSHTFVSLRFVRFNFPSKIVDSSPRHKNKDSPDNPKLYSDWESTSPCLVTANVPVTFPLYVALALQAPKRVSWYFSSTLPAPLALYAPKEH